MHWPQHFPPGCPPKSAIPASGPVYRLVDNDPVKPHDLKSYFERNRRKFKYKAPTSMEVGVSVCKKYSDIEFTMRTARGMDNKKIAVGTLDSTLGKIKHTPAKSKLSHHTWWVPDAVSPVGAGWQVIEYRNPKKSKTVSLKSKTAKTVP